MWALQMKTGPEAGAWTWLNFKMEPWESPNSPYFGASLAALAVGSAPEGYAASPEIQDRVKALRGYFQRQHGNVSLLNQLMGLWASEPRSWPAHRRSSVKRPSTPRSPSAARRRVEHGALGSYQRMDNTESDTRTDGYATALATLALQAAGVPATDPRVAKGLDWLRRNQDRADRPLGGVSPNKQRDPESDPGKFMSDAADGVRRALAHLRKVAGAGGAVAGLSNLRSSSLSCAIESWIRAAAEAVYAIEEPDASG